MNNIEEKLLRILDKLQAVKHLGKSYEAKCPAHQDGKASLTLTIGDTGAVVICCHAGCSTKSIMSAIGMRMEDLFQPKEAKIRAKSVKSYDYSGPDGELRYEVCRMEPKDFRQRRPDGKGGWIWNLEGVKRVLYRLPELLNSAEMRPDEWVFVVEGEKDADRLHALGLIATCNAGGAESKPVGAGKKWLAAYSETLRGRRVCLIEDNDDSGRRHVLYVGADLSGKAADVRVLRPAGVPVKGDISDYLNANPFTAAAEMLHMADAAPKWEKPNQIEEALALIPEPAPAEDTGQRTNDAPTLVEGVEVAKQMTDTGNAARFVARHGEDFRYCYSFASWLGWDGKRWKRDDIGSAVAKAKATVLSIFAESHQALQDSERASDSVSAERHAKRASQLATFAIQSQKKERVMGMLALAQPEIAILPPAFDADPLLLNAQNCSIDLRTGIARPHHKPDLCTRICRASYRAGVMAPTFNAFLQRIFRSMPTLPDHIQKCIGYAATGVTTEQALFFLYGRGANGKTTLIEAVSHVLGDYAGKADPDLLMARDGGGAHPTGIADLMGRRLVVCSETNEGKRFDEARLKDLVGEAKLKARFMRQDFFEFTATHKVMMYSNHRPLVRGTDHGFWRRMRLIPFLETIGAEEKDEDLPEKLKAEADGILSWIVAGAVRWHREGLGIPPEIEEATKDYRAAMDTVGTFLSEQCQESDPDRESVYAGEIYAAYVKWAEAAGEHPVSQKRLGSTLTERGFLRDRCSFSGKYMWKGIGLIPQDERR